MMSKSLYLEAVAGHLLHEDARIALGELAALKKVHVLEPGVVHQREASNLLLQPEAKIDRRLHGANLYKSEAVRKDG